MPTNSLQPTGAYILPDSSPRMDGPARTSRLPYHRPQYYYQNVFWSETNCIEYSSQLDANGNINTQQSNACPTTPPGSGVVQSYTGYVVADTLREGIWRGNAGYLRTVPLTAEGRVNWNAAPAWSQVGGSTRPRPG